ncbi:MAG: glycoside hydrolase family 99-like domain-containing protein, partial [Verrucomicrobiales bacterium]|nr:glycoside hydrolase family 99-like domain-containing protein [Verrucomicrobiales bacterium]
MGQTNRQPRYDVAAFIWPSCHDEPRSRELLWPEGVGEWEIINRGTPRFPGHAQPRQPLWGCEMDDDPRVVERWIDTATA